MRTARALIDARVSRRKSFRLLLKLRQEYHSCKALSAVRIYADDCSNVLVQENRQIWNAETGQGQIVFNPEPLLAGNGASGGVSQLPGTAAQITAKHTVEELELEDLDSDDWYNLALDLEDMDPERAPGAYRRAITLNPENADAHVNLGRLYQLQGDIRHAKDHYQIALRAVSDHQLARYNLGTLFDELDELESAIEHYAAAPTLPDAHYNLARIFKTRGDEVSSRRHMRAYERMRTLHFCPD